MFKTWTKFFAVLFCLFPVLQPAVDRFNFWTFGHLQAIPATYGVLAAKLARCDGASGSEGFRKMHFRKMHFSKILQIFGGLVLCGIKTKFCKKICVWQHFASSTRFASFCTAAISKFSQKIGFKNQQFSWKFSKFCKCRKILPNFKTFSKKMKIW